MLQTASNSFRFSFASYSSSFESLEIVTRLFVTAKSLVAFGVCFCFVHNFSCSETPCFQRLKLRCQEPRSPVSFEYVSVTMPFSAGQNNFRVSMFCCFLEKNRTMNNVMFFNFKGFFAHILWFFEHYFSKTHSTMSSLSRAPVTSIDGVHFSHSVVRSV